MTYFMRATGVLPGENVPYHLRAGDGYNLTTSPHGDVASIKAGGGENDGRVAFLEYRPAVNAPGPAPHTHENHEELFYVVSGRLSMLVGEQVIRCDPGDFAYAPRRVAHTFWNEGPEPCTFVATFSPAGFERIFEHAQIGIESGVAPTPEEMDRLAREFDMTIVAWPPGTEPHFPGAPR